MLIAQQKRKENIAEYLLYMWQLEDLIRACHLEDDKIEQLLVSRFLSVPNADVHAIKTWYLELRDMMLQEGKREQGHLQVNDNIVIDMTDLHQHLLRQGQDAIYTSCYYSTLPYIVELRSKQKGADEGKLPLGELETCFTALYGLMLLRMQKQEVGEQTQVAMNQISKFLGLLSLKYKEWKAGELKFPDN